MSRLRPLSPSQGNYVCNWWNILISIIWPHQRFVTAKILMSWFPTSPAVVVEAQELSVSQSVVGHIIKQIDVNGEVLERQLEAVYDTCRNRALVWGGRSNTVHPPNRDPPVVKKFFIRILMNIANLNFFAELLTFDLHKGSRHSFHVRVRTFKGDPPASDWVFVLVGVNSCIHYTWLGRVASVKPPVYKATAFSASYDGGTSK